MENKMRTAILSSIMALLVSGCAAPAFQPFQAKVDKTTSNMTSREKQIFLNYFIKNFSTFKTTDAECVLYQEKIDNFTKNHKHCYTIKDNIINKTDATSCTFYDRTSGTVSNSPCLLVPSKDVLFNESILNLEKNISLNFNKYLSEYESHNTGDIDVFFKYKADNSGEKDFKNYLLNFKKREQERYLEATEELKKIEQERELKEQAEKYFEAANKLKKIEQLRERKGQHIMTFFETCKYRAYGYKDLGGRYQHVSEQAAEKMCRETCSQYVFNNSGYDNLQEALNDGWKFKAKAKESKEQINEYCVCEGNSYVLEK